MKFSRCPDDLSLVMMYREFSEDTTSGSWADDPEDREAEFVQWLMVHITSDLLPYEKDGLCAIRRAYQEALRLLGHS